jgi:hypothetical protein
MVWQEKRVADSEAETGRIDHNWDGGIIIDFAEQERQRRARARQRIAEWVDGVEDGWRVDDGEEKVIDEEERVVPEVREELLFDSLEELEATKENDDNDKEDCKKDGEEGKDWQFWADGGGETAP